MFLDLTEYTPAAHYAANPPLTLGSGLRGALLPRLMDISRDGKGLLDTKYRLTDSIYTQVRSWQLMDE